MLLLKLQQKKKGTDTKMNKIEETQDKKSDFHVILENIRAYFERVSSRTPDVPTWVFNYF